MQVKLLKIVGDYYDPGTDVYKCLIKGFSDWEEVTPEYYQYLQTFVSRHNNYRTLEGYTYLLVTPAPEEELAKKVKELISEDEKRVALRVKELEEYKAKQEKIKADRALKKRAKTEEQEKKLLEDLQKKYGNVPS